MHFKLKLIPIKNAEFFNREIIHRCTGEHTHLITSKFFNYFGWDTIQCDVTTLLTHQNFIQVQNTQTTAINVLHGGRYAATLQRLLEHAAAANHLLILVVYYSCR